jgi:hypothetical protein
MRPRHPVWLRAAAAAFVAVGIGLVAGSAPAFAKSAKKAVAITGDFTVGAVVSGCGQLSHVGPDRAGTRTMFLTVPTGKKPGPSGGSYELDYSAVPLGTTTTFPPTPNAVPTLTPTIRFSYNADTDYLDWGGPATSGTLKVSADGKSGTVDLQLPFVGDDARKVPATAHKAVHVKGTFSCPAGSP